jgi:hypothetical protein
MLKARLSSMSCVKKRFFWIHSAGYAVFVAETRGFLIIMKKVPQVFRNPGGSPALRNEEPIRFFGGYCHSLITRALL